MMVKIVKWKCASNVLWDSKIPLYLKGKFCKMVVRLVCHMTQNVGGNKVSTYAKYKWGKDDDVMMDV